MSGIDKKACRKFLDPGLYMDMDNGLLHTETIKYIIHTAIKIIGHRRLLILYLYLRDQAAQGIFKPVYTMFQASDDFITFDHNENTKTRWRIAMFENLEHDYFFTRKCAFYTRTDEQRVIHFCRPPSGASVNGYFALSRLQNNLREVQLKKRQKERERKIVDRMRPLKPISKRVLDWMRRDLLPKYLFYDYKKGRTTVAAHCSGCGQEVLITEARHNKKGICPACHSEATMKSRGKVGHLWDRISAQTIQQLPGGELVIRILKGQCSYDFGSTKYSVVESARYFLRQDAEKRYVIEPYYYSFGSQKLTPWKKGQRPVFSYYQENFMADPSGYLYTENLHEALMGTPWQYCQISEFYLSDPEPMDAETYLREYLKLPLIEYLVKLRLYRLAESVIYHSHEYKFSQRAHISVSGKNLREILGVTKEDIPLLQALNASYKQLGLLQGMRRMGFRPDQTVLEWCGKYGVSRLNDILSPLKFTTAHKLMRYMEEQYKNYKRPQNAPWGKGYQSLSNALSDYRDYLCMCEGLDYDMSSTFVLFPRSLPEAHDRVMELSDGDKAQVYNKQIAGQYQELFQQYQFETKDMMIVPPKTAKELTEEGQKLHHCVGGYVKRVAMRECVILFLRRKSTPNKPFCTIELANNEIVQVKGRNNESIPPDAEKFLELWKMRVLQAPVLKAA